MYFVYIFFDNNAYCELHFTAQIILQQTLDYSWSVYIFFGNNSCCELHFMVHIYAVIDFMYAVYQALL